jgi:hypothetical protein
MVTGLNLAHGLRRSAQWPAMRGRPGHGLAAQPSPAKDTVHDGRDVRAHGQVTARSSHARRCGDALDDGAVGVGQRQGVVSKHRWGPGVASGKKSGDGAHRGGQATVGRREVASAAVFRWEGGSDGVVAPSGQSHG